MENLKCLFCGSDLVIDKNGSHPYVCLNHMDHKYREYYTDGELREILAAICYPETKTTLYISSNSANFNSVYPPNYRRNYTEISIIDDVVREDKVIKTIDYALSREEISDYIRVLRKGLVFI